MSWRASVFGRFGCLKVAKDVCLVAGCVAGSAVLPGSAMAATPPEAGSTGARAVSGESAVGAACPDDDRWPSGIMWIPELRIARAKEVVAAASAAREAASTAVTKAERLGTLKRSDPPQRIAELRVAWDRAVEAQTALVWAESDLWGVCNGFVPPEGVRPSGGYVWSRGAAAYRKAFGIDEGGKSIVPGWAPNGYSPDVRDKYNEIIEFDKQLVQAVAKAQEVRLDFETEKMKVAKAAAARARAAHLSATRANRGRDSRAARAEITAAKREIKQAEAARDGALDEVIEAQREEQAAHEETVVTKRAARLFAQDEAENALKEEANARDRVTRAKQDLEKANADLATAKDELDQSASAPLGWEEGREARGEAREQRRKDRNARERARQTANEAREDRHEEREARARKRAKRLRGSR